jgi:hypothetical protein
MPNKIYLHEEAGTITWDSAGTTESFTPTSLATVSGRQGAYHDFGTSARSRLYRWRAWLKPGATRVVGQQVQIYWTTGDGTHYDNDDGTGDIALSAADKLRNLQQIGTVVIDENAAVDMGSSGVIEVETRYGAPVFYNATANSLSATATDYGFKLTPIPDEIQ